MTESVTVNINLDEFPKCPKCKEGVLLPIYDTTREGGTFLCKGWICAHCEYNIVMKSGDLYHMIVHKDSLK